MDSKDGVDSLAQSTGPDPSADDRLAFLARTLVRRADRAALGTLSVDRPFLSLVGVATDIDGTPILLLSRLAEHTRAILKDPRVSLLIDGTAGFDNPQQGPRVTLLGRIERGADQRLRRRFLARHPAASLYADFADFAFYAVVLERIYWVGGFARARWLVPRPACTPSMARTFDAALPDLQARMDREHAGMLGLIARRHLGKRGQDWHLASVDPDGCDLVGRSRVHRLSFEAPLATPDALPETLIDLARPIQDAS